MSDEPANYIALYTDHVARMRKLLSTDAALRLAVGGEFEAIGKLEYYLLRQFGFGSAPTLVVDVGCGSGRLACQLAPHANCEYIGTDPVSELFAYAQKLSNRPDWRFLKTEDNSIPCGEGKADFICFFSVFTHLYPQDIYRYLTDAKRALKPEGKILFTFLEFKIECHWGIFEASLDSANKHVHLDQFISRDAIEAWARKIGLKVVTIEDGDQPHIPLPEPVSYEDGRVMTGLGNFGQSVCVLGL